MRNLFLVGFVAAMLVGVRTVDTSAQPKETAKKAAPTGSVVISQGKDDKWRFKVLDSDDKYLCGSPIGFATSKECEAAVANVKEVIAKAKVTVAKDKDKDDKKDK